MGIGYVEGACSEGLWEIRVSTVEERDSDIQQGDW